jgi:ribosome-interacting GTPase 1
MPMPHRTFAALAKRRLRQGRQRAHSGGARAARRATGLQERSVRGPAQVAAGRDRGHPCPLARQIQRDSIAVRREGAAQIALVGPPNVGKSSLLQALSEIQIKTGDYPFTTLRPVPALTRIGGVLVQLVEIPGLIEGASDDRGGGRALLGVLRSADAIVYCCRIWRLTGLLRVQLRNAGRVDEEPLALPIGATVTDVAEAVHGQLAESFSGARIWGPSARFDGQRVGRAHAVSDGDVVEIV